MVQTVLLGEAWGEQEEKIRRPFVGSSGIELLKMCGQAKLIEFTREDQHFISQFWDTLDPHNVDMAWSLHPEIHRTNVFNLRPAGNKIEDVCTAKEWALPGYPPLMPGKYVDKKHAPQLERLADELDQINPNLVVALGNTPCWALLGQTGISKLRGVTQRSALTITGFKILPTYHPAAVMRQWELRPVAITDLTKATREREYPEIRRPKRRIFIPESVEDLYTFEREHLRHCERLSVDIETAGTQITIVGVAPSRNVALVIPFVHRQRVGRSYWNSHDTEKEVWKFVKRTLESPIPKTFQNGLYDIAFLYRAVRIRVMNAEHDTMLLHHSMQPESLKSLGFLGSVYTDEGAWKTMRNVETVKRDD